METIWREIGAITDKPECLNVRLALDSGEIREEIIYVAHGQTKGEALRDRFWDGITDEALRTEGIIK